jgi:ubiquinone/menaquinone biosynthesis C-methylase UbiE
MAQEGIPVTGVELSPHMHRVTARKLRNPSIGIGRVRATAEAIPFPVGAFKNLVVTFPSNYILSAATLSEIRRVLDNNGRGVVVGLGVRFNSRLLRILTGGILGRDAVGPIHNFTYLAEQAGLRVTQVMHTADAYTLPVMILELGDVDCA